MLESITGFMEGLIVSVFILVGYFLPTILAGAIGNINTAAIFVLNLFLGWTGLGWIIALIWALIK